MVWYGIVWYVMVWYGLVWYGIMHACMYNVYALFLIVIILIIFVIIIFTMMFFLYEYIWTNLNQFDPCSWRIWPIEWKPQSKHGTVYGVLSSQHGSGFPVLGIHPYENGRMTIPFCGKINHVYIYKWVNQLQYGHSPPPIHGMIFRYGPVDWKLGYHPDLSYHWTSTMFQPF